MVAVQTRRRLFLLSMLATTLGVIVLTGWLLWRGQPRSVVAILNYGGFVRYGDEGELNERGSVGEPSGEANGPNWLRHIARSSFTDVVQVSLVYALAEDGKRLECDRVTDDVLVELRRLPHLRELLLHKTQATDGGLANIRGLTDLELLYMWDASALTDEGLRNLEPLTKLRYLHLSGSQITSAGFRHLKSLTRLEELSLQENNLSDDGLEYLQGLTNLRSLHLGMSRGHITDDGLKKLSSLAKLEILDIQYTNVTDQGLEHLKGLPRLREIWFSGSQITESGLRRLGFTDSGRARIAKKEAAEILDQEVNGP
jgi:hypothetical protein